MDLNSILRAVKKSYTPRKKVDFEDIHLHIEMEPPTALEEVKIMESLKDKEGAQYMEALKRHSLACAIKFMSLKDDENDVVFDFTDVEMVNYEDDGKKKSKSKFLYLIDYLGQFPETLLGILFEAYSNMLEEIDERIRKQAKFEVFKVSEKPPEDKESDLKQESTSEEIPDEDLTDTEKLDRQVKRELEEADRQIAQKE